MFVSVYIPSLAFCVLWFHNNFILSDSVGHSSEVPLTPTSGPKFKLPPGDLRAGHYLVNPQLNASSVATLNVSRPSITSFTVRVTYGDLVTYFWLVRIGQSWVFIIYYSAGWVLIGCCHSLLFIWLVLLFYNLPPFPLFMKHVIRVRVYN